MEEFARKGVVDLGPKAADRDVDDVGVAVEIHGPDLLGDEVGREDFAGVLGEQGEESEFLGCKLKAQSGAARTLAQ
jgi:hypothetical protein